MLTVNDGATLRLAAVMIEGKIVGNKLGVKLGWEVTVIEGTKLGLEGSACNNTDGKKLENAVGLEEG